MAKKKTAIQEIEECRVNIGDSIKRWNDLREGKGTDPFWPDGVNMNLVRNHISYDRNRIKELCYNNGIMLPEEATYDLPPEVPQNLYLRETVGSVFERQKEFHELVFLEEPLPVYDPKPVGQLCFW